MTAGGSSRIESIGRWLVEDFQLRDELSILESDNYAAEKRDNQPHIVSSVTVERWCLVAVSCLINLVTSRLLYTKAIR